MNLCFLTKYPPIEGGVSRDCYWMARGLANRGHTVFVVTNADEVEPEYRLYLSPEDLVPGGPYAPAFPESGGSVRVQSTHPPGRELSYIPRDNPIVSRLATIATDTIRREGCRVIFTYYLEPYAVAAHLASRWTGVPYVFRHAGSDLNRLMASPELETGYREVIAGASRVLSAGVSAERLIASGIDPNRITAGGHIPLPADRFSPNARPLDVNALLAKTVQRGLLSTPWEPNEQPIDDGVPVLGVYGKLGVTKGSFNLLYALADLVRDGFPCILLVMAHGRLEPRFRAEAEQLGLAPFIRILPFLPHWRVPGFIRRCTAVAFLERDFPIAVHGPQIPTEVISCGTCLVVSGEVARKQATVRQMRNRENVIVVGDPKQVFVLADALRYALEDPARAAEIGRRGFAELRGDRGPGTGLEALEALLAEVAEETPVGA